MPTARAREQKRRICLTSTSVCHQIGRANTKVSMGFLDDDDDDDDDDDSEC